MKLPELDISDDEIMNWYEQEGEEVIPDDEGVRIEELIDL
jgi:hypothetical protein